MLLLQQKTKINIKGNYEFEKFLLENPNRLVIDIENALLEVNGPKEIIPKNQISLDGLDTELLMLPMESNLYYI